MKLASPFTAIVIAGILCACSEGAKFEYDEAKALQKEVSGENAFAHVEALVGFGPRPAGSDAIEESRLYIEKSLGDLGWSVERQSFESLTQQGKRTFVNLRARFGGADRRDDDVRGLLCSHYDTKYFEAFEFVGANDAGSSTGLLIELARVLALNPQVANEIELVFFDGEEAFGSNITGKDGLFGSKHYAAQIVAENRKKRPEWGILLDMVGDKNLNIRAGVRIPRSGLRELAEAKESGYLVDIEKVQERVDQMSRELLSASDDLELRSYIGISPDYIVDDHVPLNVVAGIPTIDLIDFDFPYWHTQNDTLSEISAESLEITGRVTLQLVEKYLMP
ncbi:M28 family peptidase [Verrucomicrobiales bacterium BCK34]|nr:M28 family peptidase [Verrucomicrobiales bacterium BCK34]